MIDLFKGPMTVLRSTIWLPWKIEGSNRVLRWRGGGRFGFDNRLREEKILKGSIKCHSSQSVLWSQIYFEDDRTVTSLHEFRPPHLFLVLDPILRDETTQSLVRYPLSSHISNLLWHDTVVFVWRRFSSLSWIFYFLFLFFPPIFPQSKYWVPVESRESHCVVQ